MGSLCCLAEASVRLGLMEGGGAEPRAPAAGAQQKIGRCAQCNDLHGAEFLDKGGFGTDGVASREGRRESECESYLQDGRKRTPHPSAQNWIFDREPSAGAAPHLPPFARSSGSLAGRWPRPFTRGFG